MKPTTSLSPVVRAFGAHERRSRRKGTAPCVADLVAQPLDVRRGTKPSSLIARPGAKDVAVTEHALPTGGSVLVYTPPGGRRRRPGVVSIHGGGWFAGSAPAIDGWSRHIARVLDAVVVAVDYRLAPEHPYPAGLDDCIAALRWLREQADELEVDVARLAVTGDSAGGNLSAALALHDCDRGSSPPLVSQVLVYPAVDLTVSDPWMTGIAGAGITHQDCLDLVELYLPEGVDPRQEPLASPWHAPSLAGLPPALIVTGGNDVLREQGRRYAERLAAEGVPAAWRDFRGMPHGFFGADRLLLSSRRAQAAVLAELRLRLTAHESGR